MEEESGRALPTEAIDYRRRDLRALEWVVVASLPDVALWHRARGLLDRQGILCRMGGRSNENGADILVLTTEAEWARDVLSKGMPPLADVAPPIRGFPVVVKSEQTVRQQLTAPTDDQDETSSAISAIPVARTELSCEQQARYTAILTILWVAIGLIALLVIPMLFGLVR